MTGIELIAKERLEQIEKHGRTVEADKKYTKNQLLNAAIVIANHKMNLNPEEIDELCPVGWNLKIWRKMMAKDYKSRLVISGALLAAEIDRIS